jgi:hypothetical protein
MFIRRHRMTGMLRVLWPRARAQDFAMAVVSVSPGS